MMTIYNTDTGELMELPTREEIEAEEDAALLEWLLARYPDEIV